MGILNLGGGSGLLGLGGIGGVSSTGALGTMGGLLDPQEMKKQQIKNAMLQAGISLMTNGGIGEAAGAGLLGAQQARDQFVDTAKTAYDFQRTQKQDSRQDAEWGMKLKEQERQDKIRKAQEAWMAAPDDQSLLTQAYPEVVAENRIKGMFSTPDLTSDQREYDMARKQGYKGSFLEYKKELKGEASSKPAQIVEYEYALNQLRGRGVPEDKLPTFQEFAKPKSRGIVFTNPDGTTVQIGGNSDATGLDGTSLPGELGARIGLGQSFLTKDVPEIEKAIQSGAATGPIDYHTGKLGRGDSGMVQRRMASGVDSLRRNLTGAGMSESEASDYASRYLPTLTDDAPTLQKKLDGLKADLTAVASGAINGKAGNVSGLMPKNGPLPAMTQGAPDLSTMSDDELRAILDGR